MIYPSQCFEYTFPNKPDEWLMAPFGDMGILQKFRNKQFINWKERIENPVHLEWLRNKVRITAKYGLNINVSDFRLFQSPWEERKEWIDQDENGQMMVVPRGVMKIRKWNVKKRCYENVDPHLKGAPT